MLFSSVSQMECSNAFKGIRTGFDKFLTNTENMKYVKACISQKDLEDQDASCCICLLSSIVVKKEALMVHDIAPKKMKLDPAAKVEFPRYLSYICEECQGQSYENLKKRLSDIILFWFKDLGSIWKVQSNFRTILPTSNNIWPTYQWLLFQSTNSTLTLVTIPIVTIQDPRLLLNKSYALVYDQKKKLLSAFEHKDFSNNILEKAMVDTREQVKLYLRTFKQFGEGHNERTKRKVSRINSEKYYQLYWYLRAKYLPYFVNVWSDVSDPIQLISIGVATSAYLLLLWEEDRQKEKCEDKQSFIHLKCGNGLLVHILSKEGHPGKGIDVVRHKMWDSYDSSISLEASPIYPHKLKVDADWVIGYRSDELTPWVPIIAARSSCTTCFFILPCCHYSLDKVLLGGKEDWRRASKLKYSSYLTKIAENCGFKVEGDQILMKMHCFVGRDRYRSKVDPDENYAESIDVVVKSFLKAESCSADIDEEECSGTYSYKVIEQDLIDNTETNHSVKEQAKAIIINMLLSKENISYTGEEKVTSSGHKWSEWNAGGTLEVNEVEKLVTPDVLRSYHMVMEGFLHQLSDVINVNDGKISLRDFRNANELQRRVDYFTRTYKLAQYKIKTSICWFYRCHPQGCVLTAEQCYHSHGLDDANLLHHFF